MTTGRLLAVAAGLTAALAACSSAQVANASPAKQVKPAKATTRHLPGNGYPGAAALVSKAAARVPDKTIMPPVTNPHASMPQYWRDNCLDGKDSPTEKICVFGDTKHPVLTVAMVGGSITGSWFPALRQIAKRRHWKIVTDLHGTCVWTATMLVQSTSGNKYTACYQWGKAALKDLETKIKPAVVITSGLPENGTVSDPTSGSTGSFAAIATGMAKYWMDLRKHGISVIAMRETPVMNFQVGACVAKYGRNSSECSRPAAEIIIPDPPLVRASRDTGGKIPVIDMNRFICGPKVCAPVVGNVLVYMDGRHLTARYSKTMTRYLEPRLLKAAPVLAKK